MKYGNWLLGRNPDIWLMLFPVWACWIVAFSLSPDQLQHDIPVWVFVVIVLGIDVSHVWSTIFRTYLDREEFSYHRTILIFAPIVSFVAAFSIASISVDLFWRCLAYVAVYHFVKQQFGFMRIYKAKNGDFRRKLISDNLVIYLSMLYPIVYWHISPDRQFAWFVQGDFLNLALAKNALPLITTVGNTTYFLILLWWLWEELAYGKRIGNFQLGKTLWILTTALNWFLGIVYFNSDIVFTITNVVAHGLPYLALIIFYQGRKEQIRSKSDRLRSWMNISITIFSAVLLLAFAEEYLWDSLVYRDHGSVFHQTFGYAWSDPSIIVQYLAIGLLAVPQITHYILDGYIWKNNEKNPYLKEILLK